MGRRYYSALIGAFISIVFSACSGGGHVGVPSVQSNAIAGSTRTVQSTTPPSPIIGGVIQSAGTNTLNIQGGAGCGYVNVTYTSSTQINLNGLALAAGSYISVYGTGSCATSFAATTIDVSGTTIAVSGAIDSAGSNTINVQGGTNCGYVNVAYSSGTAIWYNGASLAAGTVATVYGTGSCATSFTAARIVLTAGATPTPSPSPTPTPTPTPTATAPPNVQGTIYAVNGSTINLDGINGCGYVNVYTNGSTQYVYNGYTLTKGVYASVWGTGSCATSFTASKVVLGVPATPTPSPTPTATPTPTPTPTPTTTPSPTAPPVVLHHVLTADYCCGGYHSDTPAGGVATAKPWISYFAAPSANSDPTGTYPSYGAPGLAANGIPNSQVYAYADDSRIYTGDAEYNAVKPGGQYAAAEAKDCSGNPITVNNGGGYLTDPYQAATMSVYDADITVQYNYSAEYGLVFLDDINGYEYNDKGAFPCENGSAWTQSGASSAYASLVNGITLSSLLSGHSAPKFVVNTIGPLMIEAKGSVSTITSGIAALTGAPAIVALDCENCLADTSNAIIGNHTNYELTNQWLYVEDALIATVNARKMFWLQDQDVYSTGATSYAGRLFAFASFMLAWDPTYTVYQNAYYNYVGDGEHPNSSNPQIHVFPEEALVAYSAIGGYPATGSGIGALQDPGGTYVREYQLCYYNGAKIGACAFVVNPDSASHPVPALHQAYGHTMTISNQLDVLDGGTVSLTGPALPSSIPATTAYVLLP